MFFKINKANCKTQMIVSFSSVPSNVLGIWTLQPLGMVVEVLWGGCGGWGCTLNVAV